MRKINKKLDAYFVEKFSDAFVGLITSIINNRYDGDADAALP